MTIYGNVDSINQVFRNKELKKQNNELTRNNMIQTKMIELMDDYIQNSLEIDCIETIKEQAIQILTAEGKL